MFADECEQTTQIDDAFAVQTQGIYGRAACRRQTYQQQSVWRPGKVFAPIVAAGMKQGRVLLAQRVVSNEILITLPGGLSWRKW